MGERLAPGWASAGAFLRALAETHLGGFHPLRLGKHGFGGIVQLHRSLSEQLCAGGKTWLIVHTVIGVGLIISTCRSPLAAAYVAERGSQARGHEAGHPTRTLDWSNEPGTSMWNENATGALTPRGDPRS